MGLGLLSGGMRIARPEIRRGADGEARSISFSVPGEPVGKGRPRFTRTGHPYTPGKTGSYESLVRLTGFVVLRAVDVPAREGRDPRTHAAIRIEAHKKIKFTPSKLIL